MHRIDVAKCVVLDERTTKSEDPVVVYTYVMQKGNGETRLYHCQHVRAREQAGGRQVKMTKKGI